MRKRHPNENKTTPKHTNIMFIVRKNNKITTNMKMNHATSDGKQLRGKEALGGRR